MTLPRVLVALSIVLGFLGLAYLWTRPPPRIDDTIVLGAPSSTAHGGADSGRPARR